MQRPFTALVLQVVWQLQLNLDTISQTKSKSGQIMKLFSMKCECNSNEPLWECQIDKKDAAKLHIKQWARRKSERQVLQIATPSWDDYLLMSAAQACYCTLLK